MTRSHVLARPKYMIATATPVKPTSSPAMPIAPPPDIMSMSSAAGATTPTKPTTEMKSQMAAVRRCVLGGGASVPDAGLGAAACRATGADSTTAAPQLMQNFAPPGSERPHRAHDTVCWAMSR